MSDTRGEATVLNNISVKIYATILPSKTVAW